MTWILILWINGLSGAAELATVSFDSETHCRDAQESILSRDAVNDTTHRLSAVCVQQ